MINLKKGENINLTKTSPGLSNLRIGLGWNPDRFNTGRKADLDVSAFVCKLVNDKPQMINEKYFVFFNNLSTPDGAVKHTGDNRTGDGDGDDESLIVSLNKLPVETAEISIVVTIYEAVERNQNFGQVDRAYVKLYNADTDEVLAQYNLTDDFSRETALQFASIYRDSNGEWRFKAIGAGYEAGLDVFVQEYS